MTYFQKFFQLIKAKGIEKVIYASKSPSNLGEGLWWGYE